MSNVVNYTAAGCTYANGNSWASSDTKNPIYIGTNSAGSYKYVGRWTMPPIAKDLGEIKSVHLHIYRNSGSSSYARDLYIGCTASTNDTASVLSTGVVFSLSAGEGWKVIDVTGIAEYIASYSSTWYLLIGNPNNKNTYAEVAGHGSGKMLYLQITFSNGSKIYLSSGGTLEAYQLYHAENGSLVRYDPYHAENGALVKY